MKQISIGPNQAGQRFDKFLHKYLPEAPGSFLYKMLRKKNITLNGKKAEGKEMLSFFSQMRPLKSFPAFLLLPHLLSGKTILQAIKRPFLP